MSAATRIDRRRRSVLMLSGIGVVGLATSAMVWLASQGVVGGGTASDDGGQPTGSAGPQLAVADSAAPPPPARPVVGFVRVRDLPRGASVSIGGTRIVNGTGEVAPGTHAWRIQAPGYFPDSGTVAVVAGDTLFMDGRLAEVPRGPLPTGKLRVSAFPRSALIVVDDRLLGEGVVMDSVLTIGEHRLRVSAPGFVPFDTTITIEEGVTTPIPRIQLAEVMGPP